MKALRRSRAGFACLDFSIARRSVRNQRVEQLVRGLRDLLYCTIENRLVRLRGLRKTTEFAHKLQRRRANLFVGRRWFEVMKCFDISTHAVITYRIPCSKGSKFLILI